MFKDLFFMLYVEGGSAPTFRHYTIGSAQDEAERLARVTNKKVHVMAALDWVKQGELVWGSDSERLRLN